MAQENAGSMDPWLEQIAEATGLSVEEVMAKLADATAEVVELLGGEAGEDSRNDADADLADRPVTLTERQRRDFAAMGVRDPAAAIKRLALRRQDHARQRAQASVIGERRGREIARKGTFIK